MSHSSHHATFTWGPGPQSVFVAGGFNDWSDHATPLHKQADGSFAGDVALPWGQKQAFKYVVDGEWKVREDEAKEWDAAGNMNNVYTAPPAPVEPESHAAPAAAAAGAFGAGAVGAGAAAASSHHDSAPAHESTSSSIGEKIAEKKEQVRDLVTPNSTSSSTAGPTTSATSGNSAPRTAEATEPTSLLAASAPSAASSGFVLGAPVSGGSASHISDATGVNTGSGSFHPVPVTTSTSTLPSTSQAAAPVPVVVAAEPMPDKIEKVAANANIGDASVAGNGEGVLEKVAVVGGSVLASLGAAIGTAAIAVERATGVDLTHSAPISVEEAKAKGIDVNNLEKVDAPTDAISPVGQKPSSAAVADLDEKLKDLKMDAGVASASTGLSGLSGVNSSSSPSPNPNAKQVAVPLPGSSATDSQKDKSNDIPAQAETKANHSVVPQPQITTLSEKDPKKDRTADSGTAAPATVHTQPVSKDPAVDPKKAKEQAEARAVPREQSSSSAASPSPLATLPAGQSTAAPDQKASNIGGATSSSSTSAPKSSSAPVAAAPVSSKTTSTPSAPKPVEKDVFSSGSLPAASAGTTHSTTATQSPSPATVAPPAAAPVSAAAATGPATPVKPINGHSSTATGATAPAVAVTPSSIASTPAGTPAKASGHARDSTYGSSASGDVKKRKSGFFHKIKTAFSPKDKEKK